MACSGDGLLECNNWIALLIYFICAACGVLLLLLCYGICRQLWHRQQLSSADDVIRYKLDSTASINSHHLEDVDEYDVGYMERNPHAQSDSEQDNGATTPTPMPASKQEEFLPPYTPTRGGEQRERHASTVTNSSSTTPSLSTSRSTTSKPPLNSDDTTSNRSAALARSPAAQVEYSTAV